MTLDRRRIMNTWSPNRAVEKPKRHTIQDDNDELSRRPPSVTIGSTRVHVCRDDDRWQAWLNTEVADFDGLCIGLGPTESAARAAAIRTLAAAIQHLATAPLSTDRPPETRYPSRPQSGLDATV
jgi:hypothetical protein